METPNFKIIQFLYSSLIIGVIAFLVFTIVTVPFLYFNYNDKTEFTFLVPLFFIVGVILSRFLFKRSISKIKLTDSLFDKITNYQTANIMRGAPIEAAGLMAVVAYFSTSNYYYLIYALLSILLMFYYFPSKSKFENNIKLTIKEKSKLIRM